MNKYSRFFMPLSFFAVAHATNSKTKEGFAQCMQNHDNDTARMACARVIVNLSLDERGSEPNENDSECVKKCKNSLATTIAHMRSSLHEDEGLFPTARLLRSEKRAKLLKEQFLQCMKECE